VNPLLYLVAGVIGGSLLAAIIFLFARRRDSGVESELVKRLEMLDRAQERGERMLREEMSRGREESAQAASAMNWARRSRACARLSTFA